MSTDNAWKPANIKSISVQKRGKNEKKKDDGSRSYISLCLRLNRRL